MCGIAGIWGQAEPSRLAAMGARLVHRGPDDEGAWLDPEVGVGLVARRLAIIDVAGGHQPMTNEDGRIVTVHNGEIYNHRELREELLARGHRFATSCDTEVIVHLYEEDGVALADRLRGMFAIAIWDGGQRQLVLLRDRVGKKPLYYGQTGHEFLFASEIKALVAAAGEPPEIDRQSLADYLTWTFVPHPGTIYRQFRALPPGHVMVVRDRRIEGLRRYWQLPVTPKVTIDRTEAVDQIDSLLRQAVRLRLRSDVPVGVFLSGGIDSGVVAAMAAQESGRPITTITIGFESQGYDERPLAKRVAQRYGTDHHEILVCPEAAGILPRIAAAYDQPFADSSAIPSFYAAEAARRHVKVMLNGDGGDEVFGGYRRHVAAVWSGRLGPIDGRVLRWLCRGIGRALPAPRMYRTAYAFGHRFVRGLGLEPVARYIAWAADGIDARTRRELGGGTDPLAGVEPPDRFIRERGMDDRLDPVDRVLAMDFERVLPDDFLVKMDIATMAHGLEARSPLLDHELVEAVWRYPASVRLCGSRTKPLLRELAGRYLPAEIVAAPKRGFEIPRLRWLRHELRAMRDDVILSRTGLLAAIFDRGPLERLLRRNDGLDPDRWARQVWVLLMLGLWDQGRRDGQASAGFSGPMRLTPRPVSGR